MSQRIVSFISLSMVGLVAVGGMAIYVRGRLSPPPQNEESHVADFKFTPVPVGPLQDGSGTAGGDTQAEAKTAGADSQPKAAPDRHYTWAEVEQELAKVRADRGKSPYYHRELTEWYDRLSSPKFTQAWTSLSHLKNLEEWRREFPNSPTPLVVQAGIYISYAWDARGAGFANTVTPQAWKLFKERIDHAHELLEESLKLGVEDGEVYSNLVQVAKAKSMTIEQTRALVDEGLKRDPTYFPIYESMAEYLLPRWHGEPGDIERFAAELVEKIPGNDGLVAFALVARRASYYDRPLLYRGQYDRALLGKAGEALARRFASDQAQVQFGALCIKAAQDHAAARSIRPLVGAYHSGDYVWVLPESYDNFRKWSAAEVIPGGEIKTVFAWETGCRGFFFASNPRFIWCAPERSSTPILLDTETNQVRTTLEGPKRTIVNGIVLDRGNKRVVASYSLGDFQGWASWDLDDPSQPLIHPTTSPPRGLALHPVSPIVAWSEDNSIHFHDVIADEPRPPLPMPSVVETLKYSPDGNLLVVRAGGQFMVYDAVAEQPKYTYDTEKFGPTGKLQFLTFKTIDDQGRAWFTATDHAQKHLPHCLIRISPDGRQFDILGPELDGRPTFLSDDCRLLAIANREGLKLSPCSIEIWDLAAKKIVKQLAGEWCGIHVLAFSRDGRRLASTTENSELIKIWSLDDLAPQSQAAAANSK